MKILVIGGTRFVGRAITAELLSRGHEVTLFNRGQSNSDLFPEAEKLVGDRDGGLAPLNGRRWDAVIDTCGYVPRIVKQSAELLADAVERYVFVSTISVFASVATSGIDEHAPLGTLEDETVEEINGETYGPLKVLCEQAVEDALPGRALIIRPGLITGPHDPTDRFGYWPYRVSLGGDVLVPGRPERPIQHIDGRDLATFIVDQTEQQRADIFNATGPDYTQTMGELIEVCRGLSSEKGQIHWVDEEFLTDEEVSPWQELPMWVPEIDEQLRGFMHINCQKAIDAGLTFRPLRETASDWLAWHQTRQDHIWQNTLSPEKEEQLLRKWRQKGMAS